MFVPRMERKYPTRPASGEAGQQTGDRCQVLVVGCWLLVVGC